MAEAPKEPLSSWLMLSTSIYDKDCLTEEPGAVNVACPVLKRRRGERSPFTMRFFIKPPPELHELLSWYSSFWEPKAWLAMVPG